MDDEEIQALRSEVKRLRKALSELTPPLEALLKRRGFRIYKKEPSEDLALPAKRFLDDFYEMLKKYSFRLFIRDVIKHQEYFMKEQVARYAASDVTGAYVDFLLSVKMVEPADDGFRLIKRRIKSFGETLEWFLCETFRREFAVEAAWGVKFKRPGVGGDYDVIAKIDGSILYMEVKSSPPKQIYNSEIAAFLDRTFDLSPEIAVFFMDTELRMKDKIVPMFEEELKKRFPAPPPVTRIEKELFQICDKTFIINSKDSIAGNIEKVLNRYFRK
ncbi:MAG: hypothetical protein COZ31_07890 [Nitrospirae bacterium CG_4_10_14_3_um_filter_44_29]|nr:hypothetical protein [Nitrospirota bacterium]OIO28936.1 MAG: hypothetical protein AUJ60_06270 [Nitrospirae bacterium CG1_02_44_142]PIP70775.1 MAG: hypothetical protein COW90_03515 [Nitrospirae bacterium CG22_combo_CG10-13_8_21_14_all_44_11]PIV40767.1 MAG: hypothetical protein COS28_07100 [Nitrospirae bacterium CG02_land_8_20_14_3_00_44_33]PIV66000.1 MAG: hypothetical protein COS10_08370 [Nitrospirae bacterium CG01_land_8_20_14_3_00_44_22]PIW90574.1 MAG: hypothetical protein COZ93_01090 [Nit